MDTIVHIQQQSFGGSGWRACEITPDASRHIAQRGVYPTLADALYSLRHFQDRLSVQASREDFDTAVADVKARLSSS